MSWNAESTACYASARVDALFALFWADEAAFLVALGVLEEDFFLSTPELKKESILTMFFRKPHFAFDFWSEFVAIFWKASARISEST